MYIFNLAAKFPIVLVKSEQKRKITIFQDTINKLRRKVRSTNAHIAKEEANLHENIQNIRQQFFGIVVDLVKLM